MLVQITTNDSAVPRRNRHSIAETCAVRSSLSSSGTHTGPSLILWSYFMRQTPPCKPRYRRCCGFWVSSPAPRCALVHVRTGAETWCSGWAGIQRVVRPAQTPATSQHGYHCTMAGRPAANTIVVKPEGIARVRRMENPSAHVGKLIVRICRRRTFQKAFAKTRFALSQSHS